MNFLGGLKSKIKGIYKTSPNENEEGFPSSRMDYEDIQHSLNILQEENKILKSKVRILENSIFEDKSSSNNASVVSSSQFGKLFKEIKSTILYNTDDEQRDHLHGFKRFLYDNMLLHGNINEDDVEMLNNIQITEGDWETKKEIYLFKQRVLDKNYADMFRNLLVSNELNTYLKNKGEIPNINHVKDENIQKFQGDFNPIKSKEKENKASNFNVDKYEDNNTNKPRVFLEREKSSENSINMISMNQSNINNNAISTENKPIGKEKPFQIEDKLLSDLVISEDSNDNLMRTISRKERSSVNSHSNRTDKNIQEIKNKTPTIVGQRNTISSLLNDNLNDDLKISTLLSDNNLTASISLIENPMKSQIVENNFSKTKPEFSQNDTKDNMNILNLLNDATKTSKGNLYTSGNISNNPKIIKADLKKSLLKFVAEDDFTFGEIINTDEKLDATSNMKTSLPNSNIGNKNLNLSQTDKNSANLNIKNANLRKSQWDESEEDNQDSYL